MMSRTITRVDLTHAIHQKVGFSRSESSAMVELVLKEIADTLERGEPVKLSSFGKFTVRKKRERIGRNPKNGTPATVSRRRVVVFKPSLVLKQQMSGKQPRTSG